MFRAEPRWSHVTRVVAIRLLISWDSRASLLYLVTYSPV